MEEAETVKVGPPRQHLHEAEVGDDVTIYDAYSEEVVVLNATASDVWRLCDGNHTIEEIIELLATCYQVDPETIAGDVRSIIERFVEQGLFDEGRAW